MHSNEATCSDACKLGRFEKYANEAVSGDIQIKSNISSTIATAQYMAELVYNGV